MSTRVLVTGASGYIGSRLVTSLLEAGAQVRVSGRSAARLEGRPWSERVEIAEADLTDRPAVRRAVEGIDVVIFLVHAMGGGRGYGEREARCAHVMAEVAAAAGVSRIVYLSGLHPETADLSEHEHLSEHMASRSRVGEIMRRGAVPTVVVEAGTVIGSGSASFEIIRHLSERLPVMTAPSWSSNRIEPVAVRDVMHYLTGAALHAGEFEGVFGIGSGETGLRFSDLLIQYAEVAGLSRRRVFSVPVPVPLLSGMWIGAVTPIPLSIALPLAQSMQHDAVVQGPRLDDIVGAPPAGRTSYREAVRRALVQQKTGALASTWDDDVATAQGPQAALPTDPEWAGHTVYTDERSLGSRDVSPDEVWTIIEGIGGANGWYSVPVLWRARGVIDRALGGVGLRRGRRHVERLRVGDAVDWWRVESIEPGSVLTLRAEMRMTGRAWLQLGVDPAEGGGSRYWQKAVYFPDGLVGRAYWLAVLPFHHLVFPAMARNILRAAGAQNRTDPQGEPATRAVS